MDFGFIMKVSECRWVNKRDNSTIKRVCLRQCYACILVFDRLLAA